MCIGSFCGEGKKEMALGGEDGVIYLIQGWKLVPFIRLGLPITKLGTYSGTTSNTTGVGIGNGVSINSGKRDLLLCATQSNSLKIFLGTQVSQLLFFLFFLFLFSRWRSCSP